MMERLKTLTHEHKRALEVHGFDLMAQLEAMLRYVREYQLDVQRVREMKGGRISTSDRHHVIRRHIPELRQVCQQFTDLLDEIEDLVGSGRQTRRHG